jgi:hypothetical protein
LPLTLSIITRSILPILLPFSRRTSVPSTLSLAINAWDFRSPTDVSDMVASIATKLTRAKVPGSTIPQAHPSAAFRPVAMAAGGHVR